MVKVISKEEFVCKCYNCRSTLTYTYSDIGSYRINYDYLGDYDSVTGITCPVCYLVIKVDINGNTQTKG